MEVYAGFLEHTDYHVGRVIDTIEDLGVLDNTIIYYIIGDNGASAEGTLNGASTRWRTSTGWPGSRPPSSWCPRWTSSARPSLQPLRRGLGLGDVHPLPVDQAGRLALGRHP